MFYSNSSPLESGRTGREPVGARGRRQVASLDGLLEPRRTGHVRPAVAKQRGQAVRKLGHWLPAVLYSGLSVRCTSFMSHSVCLAATKRVSVHVRVEHVRRHEAVGRPLAGARLRLTGTARLHEL